VNHPRAKPTVPNDAATPKRFMSLEAPPNMRREG